jgi:outer membrane protein
MRYVGIVIILFTALSTQAREVNLTQALQMAEQHSFSLQKSRVNVVGAEADVKVARADRLPTLNATGTGYYVSEIPTMTISAGPVSVTRDMGTDQTYQADFRLSVPVFTGGRITGGIDAAKATFLYYSALELVDKDKTAFQTRLEYFNLQKADRQVLSAKAALSRAQVIDKNVRSLFDAGAADSVNLLEATLAVTKATFGVTQAESNRRSTEIRFAYLLGLNPSENISLSDSLPAPSSENQLAKVSQTKPELLASDAGINMSKSKLKLASADYFPTVSAFGGYSYGKPNLDRFNNRWNDYFTFGANLNWSFNIGNKTGKKRVALNNYLKAAQLDRQQLEENLNREADIYSEQLKLAFTRYQSARTEFSIAQANYLLAEAQHRDGVMASNVLLQIEADLREAESSLAASLADYYIAQSAYFYAIGSENLRKGL